MLNLFALETVTIGLLRAFDMQNISQEWLFLKVESSSEVWD